MNNNFQLPMEPDLLDDPQALPLLNSSDIPNCMNPLAKIPANATELEAAVPRQQLTPSWIPTPPMPDPPPLEPSIPLHPLPLRSARSDLDDQRRLLRLYSALPADHRGRVAVRATGSFNIQTRDGVVPGISYRHCQRLQRGYGYGYSIQPKVAMQPKGCANQRRASHAALPLLGINAEVSRAK